MKNVLKSAVSMSVIGVLLSGCTMNEAQLQVSETRRIASHLRDVAERPGAPANVSQVQVNPMAYIGAEATRNTKGDPLPARWQKERLQFGRAAPQSFQEIANIITSQTGIPVAIDNGGGPANASVATPAAGMQPGAPVVPGMGGDLAAALQTVAMTPYSAVDLGIQGTMKLSYAGTLEGFLDLVAANYNIAWEHVGGQIVFMRSVTRAYDVPALPIVSELAFKMESSGTGASEGQGQTASTGSAFNLWEDLQRTVGTIVGSSGTFQMSPQTSQVVVVAPPTVSRRVEQYLAQVNQQLSKQVALSVKVYSLALSDRSNTTSDLNVLLAGSSGRLGFVAQGVAQAGAEALPGLNFGFMDGDVSGTGLLRTLQTKGDVSTVTSTAATTLNGVPVPVQVVNTRGYARNVSVTTSGDNNQTAAIEPGEVTTGFNLHLVPKIQGDGSTLLQYGMNISELVGADNGFDVFETNGTRIQLPNISQRNFIQQAQIPNGKTLVLAGFEQVRSSNVQRGPVSSILWPLGGGRTAGVNRDLIVIAITPVVIDLNSPARTASFGG